MLLAGETEEVEVKDASGRTVAEGTVEVEKAPGAVEERPRFDPGFRRASVERDR